MPNDDPSVRYPTPIQLSFLKLHDPRVYKYNLISRHTLFPDKTNSQNNVATMFRERTFQLGMHNTFNTLLRMQH